MSWRGVLAAEWVKLRSIRSVNLTVLLGVLAAGAFEAIGYASKPTASELARGFDPVRIGYSGGFLIAVLVIGTLGVLTMSSEYGTGSIRTTFTAVPRRQAVLAAKATVLGVLSLAIGELLAFVIFFIGQSILSDWQLSVGLGDPGALRAVVGAGVFLGVIALIGLALGTLVKRSAAAVSALFALLFVAPLLAGALGDEVAKWTLMSALQAMTSTGTARSSWPTPSMAFVECAGYLVVLLSAAALAVARRDV